MARTVLSAVDGHPDRKRRCTGILYAPITPRYFESLGIPVRAGREFTRADAGIVGAGGDSKRGGCETVFRFRESDWVAGAAGDVERIRQPDQAANGGWDGGQRQVEADRATVPRQKSIGRLARSHRRVPCGLWCAPAGDPLAVFGAARAQLHEMDKDLPFFLAVEPSSGRHQLAQPRYNTALISLFAAVALTLTGVGLYGVIAYSVSQRTHEIGIRIALGCWPREVLRQFLWSGLAMAAAGVAIGLVIAKGATSLMKTLVFGASLDEPVTFAVSAAILIAVALAASYLPARRATRIDPIRAPRYEYCETGLLACSHAAERDLREILRESCAIPTIQLRRSPDLSL